MVHVTLRFSMVMSILGTACDDDTDTVATEDFIVMVVPLNASWKLPVTYFLIVGMSGVERANLVQQCLCKLTDIGVWIDSIKCDGPSRHVTMIDTLCARRGSSQTQS